MIWKSRWTHHAAIPVIGFSILGFFGAVASLVLVIGMANIAGASKKSFMAAAIFVGYCAGNVSSLSLHHAGSFANSKSLSKLLDFRAPAHQNGDTKGSLP